MASERLRRLQQQKELIQRHLDWINQEIDQEALASIPSSTPKTSRLIEAIPSARKVVDSLEPDPESKSSASVAADLYAELGPDTKSAASDAKRGCLAFGGLAFAGLACLIAYVLFYY